MNNNLVSFKEVFMGSKVMVYFKGPVQSEVDEAVRRYMYQYPYAGYLTSINRSGENVDGGYYVHLYRIRSCD